MPREKVDAVKSDRRTIVGLDIGTTKIGVVIAELMTDGELKIVGLGTHPSDGLLKGVVVNIEKTVKSIEKAVEEAEMMAGIDVRDVYVGVAGRHIRSLISRGMVSVTGNDKEIGERDVQRVMEQARTIQMPSDQQIIHLIPQGFVVDNQSGIRDPVGMTGMRLEADVHIITASTTSLQNIYKSVERAGLFVAGIVLEPLASALAVLDDEERELGVAVVDMGGGTTDLVVFVDDSIRHSASIDFGGANVTADLAIGLRTPKERAEEIKKREGSCLVSQVEDRMVEVSSVGGRPPREFPRTYLTKIIQPRVREILEMVKKEMDRQRLSNRLGAGVVLTGGGALMGGVLRVAEEVFDMPVKLGTPKRLGGLSDAVATPIHATGVGLVLYGRDQLLREGAQNQRSKGNEGDGVKETLGRVWSFIRNYI